jgi:curved DNA-binding protein CbpA
MRTHYDNLKVAENAPPEVIKAAWRALTRMHHPDHSTHVDAVVITQILNEAYEVLGDPVKREAYDARLAELRRPPPQEPAPAPMPTPPPKSKAQTPPATPRKPPMPRSKRPIPSEPLPKPIKTKQAATMAESVAMGCAVVMCC